MATFKYEIGDVLVHRGQLAEPVSDQPTRLLVLERLHQECPGGVQIHYRCRAMTRDALYQEPANILEHELAPWAEWVRATTVVTSDATRQMAKEMLAAMRQKTTGEVPG